MLLACCELEQRIRVPSLVLRVDFDFSTLVQYVEVLTLLLVRLLQLDSLHRGILAKKICSGANVPLVFLVICGTIGVFAR